MMTTWWLPIATNMLKIYHSGITMNYNELYTQKPETNEYSVAVKWFILVHNGDEWN